MELIIFPENILNFISHKLLLKIPLQSFDECELNLLNNEVNIGIQDAGKVFDNIIGLRYTSITSG